MSDLSVGILIGGLVVFIVQNGIYIFLVWHEEQIKQDVRDGEQK